MQEECTVLLLKERQILPGSYEVYDVQLTHTVWTEINDNEWIYYVARKDIMTILCGGRDPVDVPLKGRTGCLSSRHVRVMAGLHYCNLRT
jgi:hypothetical protein